MTEEIIDLKDYFVHHYDDWGRLYCVEFKGSPLELENNIKRLEQERDELKKTVENQKLEYEELQCDLSEVENACGCYQSENAELKQENKTLKDNNNHLQVIIDDGRAENKRFREENKELKEKVKELDKMTGIFSARLCDNYRSALEEIKNILKEICKEECDYTKPNFCGDCDCRYGQIVDMDKF